MYKFLFCCLVLITSEANAQLYTSVSGSNGTSTSIPTNGFSATAEGDILRGMAAYSQAQGQYLHSLGIYEGMHEATRKQYMQNNMAAIQNRLLLKEQAAARKAAQPDAIDIENARLDKIQKMAELKKRKEQMVKDGLLPAPKSNIGWHGYFFKNLEEFKKSPQWQEVIAEGEARVKAYNDELEAKKQRDIEALKIIKQYRGKTEVDIAREDDLKHANEIIARKTPMDLLIEKNMDKAEEILQERRLKQKKLEQKKLQKKPSVHKVASLD